MVPEVAFGWESYNVFAYTFVWFFFFYIFFKDQLLI